MAPKKNKFKMTYIFIAVFVLLGVYIYFFEQSANKIDREKIKIYHMAKSDIKSFEIVNGKTGETVACESDGTNWRMTKPKAYDLEKTEIDIIITNLAALTIDRKMEKPDDLSVYGLAKPSFTVNFVLKNNKNYSFYIGDKNPSGNFYYVKDKDQKDAYIAYGFSMETIMKGVKDLRKKSFFDVTTDNISKIDIKAGAKELSFMKGSDKKWLILPYNFMGDNEALDGLVTSIKDYKAMDIIEDEATDLKKYGLDKPVLTLSVTAINNSPVVISFGKKANDRDQSYAKIDNSPIIYTFSTEIIINLDKTYNDFRDKRLIFFKEGDITEVEIIKDKQKILIIKNKLSKFKIEEPKIIDVDIQTVNFIKDTAALKAENYVDDSGKKFEKYGLKTPAYIINFYVTENKERKLKTSIAIGDKVKFGYYARIDQSETVAIISTDFLDKITEIEKLQK